jgi:membrane dipeptidase
MTFLACQALGRDRTCYAFGFSGEEGMKAVVIALALLGAGAGQAVNGAEEDPALVRARKLLKENILIDGHNDLPWAIREYTQAPRDVEAYDLRVATLGDTDIERLRAGGLGAQFWSVYIPGEDKALGYARVQLEQIDIARRVIAKYPEHLALALTAADVEREFARGRIASLLGMEGGHAIENSLGALRSYYDLGVRYMTLTHGVTLDWADAAGDTARHGGLTRFGEEVVREMNRLGMLVDLSHVTPETMDDALRVSEAPVIFSHSSARAVCDVPRNVPDAILKRLPANGGVVMVTFVAAFVSQEFADVAMPVWQEYRRRTAGVADPAERQRVYKELSAAVKVPQVTIGQVADHIDHIRRVAGVDHVGIGGDFDGNDRWPEGLDDVSKYPNLFAELIRRGWSDADLAKLAGANLLRAFRAAEDVAGRLQAARPPSTATIDQLDGRGSPPAASR